MVSSMSTKECNNITFFLLNRISYEEAQMMAAEAVMTPTAHSHQSFSLDDCLPVLLPEVFSDFNIEANSQVSAHNLLH